MRSPSFSVLVAIALASLVGCASGAAGPAAASATAADPAAAAAGTTTTAAEVPSTPTSDTPDDAPAGQLTCKTKSAANGTTLLYLEWKGEAAKGTLRRVVPSGMVYDQPVRAERHKGVILVDDGAESAEVDLFSHVAVVGRENGKSLMRVGEPGQPWATCE